MDISPFVLAAVLIYTGTGLKCYDCEFFEFYFGDNWTQVGGDEYCRSDVKNTNVKELTAGKQLYCYLFIANGLLSQTQMRRAIIRGIANDHRTNLNGACESLFKYDVTGIQCYCKSDLCNVMDKTEPSNGGKKRKSCQVLFLSLVLHQLIL